MYQNSQALMERCLFLPMGGAGTLYRKEVGYQEELKTFVFRSWSLCHYREVDRW
jgi:hypothetical protein